MGQCDQAKAMWEDLAKKGNTTALINLANLFEQGNGVKKDKKEALKWLNLAKQEGESESVYYIKILEKK